MNNQRGSALVTTLILGAVMATAVASYIAASLNAMNLSDRAFNTNAAVSIAEAGVEAGLWAYNNSNWTGWTDLAANEKKISLSAFKNTQTGGSATSFDLDRGVSANATIVVYDYAGAAPYIVAQAKVWSARDANRTLVQRWVRATMKKRSFFATGLLGRDGITFSGNNASVDAYDSRLGTYNQSLGGGKYNRYAKGSIGTLTVSSTIDVNNADIWGTASIGGSNASAIDVGPQGRVGPFGTANGVKDGNSIATDFRAELPDVVVPSTTGAWSVPSGNNVTLSGSADPNAPRVYAAASISSTGLVEISGHVALVCTGMSITGGHGALWIDPNSSLQMYCSGTVNVSGNGAYNATLDAKALQIYGTAPDGFTQSIDVRGNGVMTGVVYAPRGDINLNGNGSAYGSFVGKTVHVTGNADFHYDLALAGLNVTQPATVDLWRELLDPAAWPVADFN